MRNPTEQTIRVSLESEKCFVTLKEFCERLWGNEFPTVCERVFSGRCHVTYVRDRIYWCDIDTQKNSVGHWEIDLVSAAALEARFVEEERVKAEVEELPEAAALKILVVEQERFLQETRDKLSQFREDEFQSRMPA